MWIVVTRNTYISGTCYEAGHVPVDVEETAAKQLLSLGKATAAPAPDPIAIDPSDALLPVSAETPPAATASEPPKPKGKRK